MCIGFLINFNKNQLIMVNTIATIHKRIKNMIYPQNILFIINKYSL